MEGRQSLGASCSTISRSLNNQSVKLCVCPLPDQCISQGSSFTASNTHWKLLVLLWSLLNNNCLLCSKICCCMDALPTTALHSIMQIVQQLSTRTLDRGSSALQKSKDALSDGSWRSEQFVLQNLLYSVSPNQTTSQGKLSFEKSVLLSCVRDFSFSKLELENQ